MFLSLQTLLIPVSAWFAAVSFYRLFLHPLRNFPGPWLAAVTEYYAGYYDLVKGGQLLFHIQQLHVQYGEERSRAFRAGLIPLKVLLSE